MSDDLIAQHYSLGDAPLEAIKFWRRGAGAAIARSANEEAIAMLRSALGELAKLDGTVEPELELDLVLTQATALRSARGYSAPEVEQHLARARVLCTVCGDFSNRFSVEWGLFQCTFIKGDIDGARAFATDLLEHAAHEPGEALIDAYLAKGMVAFTTGEFEAAMKFFEAGAALCRPETEQPRFLTHGQNAGLFCLSYLARSQCHLGYLDRGRATIQRARAIAAIRAQDPGISIAGSPSRSTLFASIICAMISRPKGEWPTKLSRWHAGTTTPTMRPWANASSAGWLAPRASSMPGSRC